MSIDVNRNSPWWGSWDSPHPVPNRNEPNAHLETTRERQQREREINNKLARLNKKLNNLTIQATRARTRATQLRHDTIPHAKASLKYVNLLNDQIAVREQIEDLKVMQEAA